MRKLPPDLFAKYRADPFHQDDAVRQFAGVPESRYYTVAMWPEAVAGRVEVNHQARTVKPKKVSKSDPS
jgi:hypothetical protein